MKRIAIISLMLLMITGSMNAQNAAEARKVLDKAAATISSKGGATANFSISNGKYATSNGTISIKGKMFYASTDAAIMWYNGKTQWTYMKKTNEVNVSNPNEAKQVSMNPYKFITMYRNGYNLSMTTKGNTQQVHLTAQDKKRSVQEMYIFVDKKTSVPSEVKMRQGKDWITIKVSNFKKKNLPNSVFSFQSKDYPQAEVIDLR